MTDTTTNTIDEAELSTDAKFTDALQRVAFQPGILLGADALTTEQSYHVRRMNRHQRWLFGPGTVFGLRVDLQAPAAGVTSDPVLLTVSPGHAIDGLGREVTVDQPYAISLRDWLAEQNAQSTALSAELILNLQVTVRAQAVPNQLQPVVADNGFSKQPELHEAALLLGDALLEQKKYPQALPPLEKYVQTNPQDRPRGNTDHQ